MQIHLTQKVALDATELLLLLTDHEQLSRFFNAKFSVLEPAKNENIPGGAGCLREVSTRGSTFVEEIIKADTQSIEYRIVGDKPLKNHLGIIKFIPAEGGVNVDYTISGEVPGWLPTFIVQHVIKSDISNALTKLANFANAYTKEQSNGC